LIGLGNRLRGDDAAGPELARLVAERAPGTTVIEHEGEPTELIEVWDRAALAIVADAVAPAGHPGRVHRGIGGSAPLPFSPGSPASTHALDLAGTIDLAASLGRLPARLVVYGIEGERFDLGASLSPPVAAALRSLADRVLADLAEPGRDPVSRRPRA
jgi:hydrogenase maturation protease